MEEMKPYSQKPMDRSIAVSIANGQFSWHHIAEKKNNKQQKNRKYILQALLIYPNRLET